MPAPESIAADALEAWELRLADASVWATLHTDGNAVVASAYACASRTDRGKGNAIPGHAHLFGVAVDPDLWGRGIAREVVSDVCSRAPGRDYREMQLFTHDSNARARRLYESMGWILAPETETTASGELMVRYVLELSESPRG